MKKDYGELEKRIGYEFKDIRLLITALTHTSFANDLKPFTSILFKYIN